MKKLNGTVFEAFWTRRFGEPVNFYSFGEPDIEQLEFVDTTERFIEVFKYKRKPNGSGNDHCLTFAVPKSNRDLNLVIQFIPRIDPKVDLTTTECGDAAWKFVSDYFLSVQNTFLKGDSVKRCSTVRKFYEVTKLNLLDFIDPLNWGDVPYKYYCMADSSRSVTRLGDE